MNFKTVTCAVITTLLSATALAQAEQDLWIKSRDVTIPITLVTPPATSTAPIPLAVLIHGHGGTRHEAGGFKRVADGLAARGIASVRMDFPGCGDSKEPFHHNNLSNMLADIRAAQAFAQAQLNIDAKRIGLLGFSMGGRLAMTLVGESEDDRPDYAALALWAPSAQNGAGRMLEFLGGEAGYRKAKTQAKEQGYVPFTTTWGQQQQLGYRWFTDLETSMPADAVAEFTGPVFVLYGDLDSVIPPAVAESVFDAATMSNHHVKHIVRGADHGLGLFNDDTARSEEAVQQTVAFLTQSLKPDN